MSLDSVHQSLTYQPAHRDRRLHDTDTAVRWPDGKSKHSGRDQQQQQEKPHPVVNYLGQVTGQMLDVIA